MVGEHLFGLTYVGTQHTVCFCQKYQYLSVRAMQFSIINAGGLKLTEIQQLLTVTVEEFH